MIQIAEEFVKTVHGGKVGVAIALVMAFLAGLGTGVHALWQDTANLLEERVEEKKAVAQVQQVESAVCDLFV